MRASRVVILGSAIVVAMYFNQTAQAGPVSYSYTGTSNQVVHAAAGLQGGIAFASQSGTRVTASASVTGSLLSAISSNPSGLVGNFDHISYSTGLIITDSTAPGSPHAFVFGGMLNGMLKPGKDTLTTTFTTSTTQQFQLGTNLYSVTINDLSLPGIGFTGAVTYDVNVTAVPEPSTLLLSGIGAACVGFISWRRRRRALVST